jgi:hypothetical protein
MHRLPLRDELLLLAHHDDGRPLLGERAMNVGLAGAQLADLVLAGCLHVIAGSVEVHERRPPDDEIAADAADRVDALPEPRPVRACLDRVAPALYERAAGTLLAEGLLTRGSRRRLGLLPAVRYTPDPAAAARVRGRVRYAVQGLQEPDAQCATLCALLRVLRLESTLALNASTGELSGRLAAIERDQYPPLQDLVAGVAAALGRAVPTAQR